MPFPLLLAPFLTKTFLKVGFILGQMLAVYNTLGRVKQEFVPVDDDRVKMYVCGMTVYSDAHIGHARTYLAFDIIRRYLEYRGYEVTYVQNITDVDDKIIGAAGERGMDPLGYSALYTERCLEDMDRLGIRRADLYPKASEHIQDIIAMIADIMDNGYAYAADGDVYFSVERFPDYGKLSGQQVDEMKAGARIAPGEQKRNPLDFALWKAAKPGEPSWPSPWGEGRPGWHIECSVMSSVYLGMPFDIHGGGRDLIFPHHENEITQAEAATRKQFARYWLHSGMLKVNGEKMSKSLGNFVTIRDALERWDAEALRFFFASYHYRSPADFSEKNVEQARRGLERIHRLRDDLRAAAGDADAAVDKETLDKRGKAFYDVIQMFRKDFEEAMDDDFNTPEAVAAIFSFVKEANRHLQDGPPPEICARAQSVLEQLGGVLTLFQEEAEEVDLAPLADLARRYGGSGDGELEAVMGELLAIRQRARKEKDWATADAIRDRLADLGFEVQDTPEGAKWRRL